MTHTWKTNLILTAGDDTFRDVREWLKEYDASSRPPSRDDDALAKYLRLVLISNSQWDAVRLGIKLDRPRPLGQPAEYGPECDDTSGHVANSEPRSRLALAVDGFAALMVLACIALVATRAFTHSPPTPVSWYNGGHATSASVSPRSPD